MILENKDDDIYPQINDMHLPPWPLEHHWNSSYLLLSADKCPENVTAFYIWNPEEAGKPNNFFLSHFNEYIEKDHRHRKKEDLR